MQAQDLITTKKGEDFQARVKNMYHQDLRSMRSSIGMKRKPFLACTPVSAAGTLLPVEGYP